MRRWRGPRHSPVMAAGRVDTLSGRARQSFVAGWQPARVLAECEAKRRIVEWHQNWPVMVETQPTIEPVESADPTQFAYRASQQLAWMTEREYRARFGTEPPTSPILRLLAMPYADHPDYLPEWKP
jgi:hypothetical protein